MCKTSKRILKRSHLTAMKLPSNIEISQ